MRRCVKKLKETPSGSPGHAEFNAGPGRSGQSLRSAVVPVHQQPELQAALDHVAPPDPRLLCFYSKFAFADRNLRPTGAPVAPLL